MKARTAWILGGLFAVLVAVNRLFRRPAPVAPAPPPGPDPRAEQLREKLAESRAAVDEMERERVAEPPAAEEQPDEPAAEESIEERRKRIRERGEAAARNMRRPPDPPTRG